MVTSSAQKKRVYNPDLDDLQKELYKKFPPNHFLSNPINCDHFLRWNTFFRRNYQRFAIDYLKINLYEYQALSLYELGVNNMTVIIASRAAAKSFLIALYACIRCILYPGTKILLSSAKNILNVKIGILIRNNQVINRGVSVKSANHLDNTESNNI